MKSETIVSLIVGLLFACSTYLSVRLEQEKSEKQRAISELNEIRTEKEWRNL